MPRSVVIALGSNLGDRALNLRRALAALRSVMTPVRAGRVVESAAVDSPAGSPPFLNTVVVGYTDLAPEALLEALLAIERRFGRRRGVRNAPRTIDLDLILFGAEMRDRTHLTLPHARYLDREFVMQPLRELDLPWRDPRTGVALS